MFDTAPYPVPKGLSDFGSQSYSRNSDAIALLQRETMTGKASLPGSLYSNCRRPQSAANHSVAGAHAWCIPSSNGVTDGLHGRAGRSEDRRRPASAGGMLNPSIMPSSGTLFPTNVIPRFKQPRPSVERVVEAALQYYRRLDKELRQMGLKPADRRLFIQTLRLRPDVTQEEVIAATKQINVPTTHEEDGEGAAPAPANGALDMVAELELMREIALAEQRRAAELELALADAQSGDSALRGAANDSRQSSEDARLLLRRAEAAHERERKAWASRTEEAVAQLADLRRMQEQEAWRKKKEDHVNQSKVQKADRLVDSMDKAVFRADSRKLQIASHYRKPESELSQRTENNVVARRDFKAAIAHASKVNDEQGAHVMRLQAANIELVRRMRVATDTLKRNSKFAKQCDDAAGAF